MTTIAATLYGQDPPSIGQIANVRMLLFESATLVVAFLKAQATVDDADVTGRKLPHVEKQARLDDQKRRLSGVLIEGELQPSYALIDACSLIVDSNSITWLAPSKCTKRDSEVQLLGKEKTSLVQVESGALKLSASQRIPDADTSSAIQLLYCLQRRGLALDQCSLVSWTGHEFYVHSLMAYLHAEPAVGTGRVSVAQVIRADREAWTIMSREITGSVSARDGNNQLVMEAALKKLVSDPRVVIHLLAPPVRSQSSRSKPLSNRAPLPPPRPHPASEGKGRKRKRKRASASLPESLKGCKCRIKEGPVCWSFNLEGGCSLETKAGKPAPRCIKGFHVCAHCHRPGHSFVVCRTKNRE